MLDLTNFNGKKFFDLLSPQDAINLYNTLVIENNCDIEIVTSTENLGDYFGCDVEKFINHYIPGAAAADYFVIDVYEHIYFLSLFQCVDYVNSDSIPYLLNMDWDISERVLKESGLEEEAGEAGAIFSDD